MSYYEKEVEQYQLRHRLLKKAEVIRDHDDSGRSDADVSMDAQLDRLQREAGWGIAVSESVAHIGLESPLEVSET